MQAFYHESERVPLHRETPAAKRAFLAYLEMGHERSLRKLGERLKEEWGAAAPCQSTLENWSGWFGWQARACEHDECVMAAAKAELEQVFAREAAERALQRLRVTGKMADDAEAAINQLQPGLDTFRQLAFDGSGKLFLDWIKTAWGSDRLDFGVPTSRTETLNGFGNRAGSRPGHLSNDSAPAFRPVTSEEEAEMRVQFVELIRSLEALRRPIQDAGED